MTLSLFRSFTSLSKSTFYSCLIVSAFHSPLMAQDKMIDDENRVMATINGKAITQKDMALAVEDFSAQLQQVPPQQRMQSLIDAMIDMQLLADAAKKEGLEQSEYYQNRLEFLKMRALRTAYLVDKVAGTIKDEEVKAAYDKAAKEFEPKEELKARHILVKEEDEAKALIQQLDEGADFQVLAKEKSTGPSAPAGGDLGWFGEGRMVPAFEGAAKALEKGSYTKQPVESRFGWHVILLEDKRLSSPPPFDQVQGQFRQELLQSRFQETIEALRGKADIEYVGEGLVAPQNESKPAE